MEWVFWIAAGLLAGYWVLLLIEFNTPAQKLRAQIEAQEERRLEMEERLLGFEQEKVKAQSYLATLDNEWQELEHYRRELLLRANIRYMIKIPAGPFPMGSADSDSPSNERPLHTVHLSEYYISPFPVTNVEYREFVNCTGHRPPNHWLRGTYAPGLGRHPVVNISWRDAQAYAEWAGARLPSEAEWEKAARGADQRQYPWGHRFLDERCNCGNASGNTLPVDEFPLGRSPYGAWDMAGNVYEWCHDLYDKAYYKNSPASNPKGPDSGTGYAIRGGCFQENRSGVRCPHRAFAEADETRTIIGFRIAMDVET